MTSTPRALVVGASETAALLHLPVLAALRDAGRLQLMEICDLRLESAGAMRDRFGFARESGDAAAAIARDDIDLVYLFGGARMHHALGLAALEAGKHLFVEKPIAPSYAEAMALADAARERGLIAVGGHNRRFLSAFDGIAREAGRAGWTFAEAVFHKPAFGEPAPFGAATWLSGNGIHALDALVFMMGGLPDSLVAHVDGRGPSVCIALMRWPNGAQGVLLSNNEAGARREEYSFHASGETWQVTDEGLTLDRDGVRSQFGCSPVGDGFAAEHAAFLDSVANGVAPRHAISALAPSLFLAELIEAGHQGPVRLPERKVQPTLGASGPSVVLENVERQRSTLGAIPSHWRLVALEEVERSSAARPDITAAILATGAPPISAETLDKLPNLAVVGVIGLSVARYDPDRLLDRGVALVNASQAYAESVAEFALGLAILGRRRAFLSSEAMRRGGWGTSVPRGETLLSVARRARRVANKLGIADMLARGWRSHPRLAALSAPNPQQSRDLSGALVGLIGWGANASAFTRRLIASGARVIVHSEHASAEDIRASGAEPVSLASVLAADIVSLHRGLTPSTRQRIGAAELARLRPGAVLINAARGALTDENALLARLARGDIFACLDTFDEEPLPRRHPLRRLPNAFLTSHIAGGSSDMHAAAAREVIDKVARHLDGDPVATLRAERLATMT
jgi:phosphoglycerate dehydrogenase-like enzyme/predicted dehydrogenase